MVDNTRVFREVVASIRQASLNLHLTWRALFVVHYSSGRLANLAIVVVLGFGLGHHH